MEVTVSFGELLDKLSILDIKRELFTDETKIKNVQAEIDAIKPKADLLLNQPIQRFYYRMLKDINLVIWHLSDHIREHPEDVKACSDIIKHNDRRFRVKNKINTASPIKEQKGYPIKRCVFIGHTESGDQLTNIGIVRYLSTEYDQVIVVSKDWNSSLVKDLYADDPNILVIIKNLPYKVHINFPEEFSEYPGATFIPVGFYKHPTIKGNMPNFFDQFYIDAGVPPVYRFLYNYIPRNEIAENAVINKYIPKDCTGYHFMHSRGVIKFITDEYLNKLSDNGIFVFNPTFNVYPKTHKWFGYWTEKAKGTNLLHFSTLLEKAGGFQVNDSAFFCLINYLSPVSNRLYFRMSVPFYNISGYCNPKQKWLPF